MHAANCPAGDEQLCAGALGALESTGAQRPSAALLLCCAAALLSLAAGSGAGISFRFVATGEDCPDERASFFACCCSRRHEPPFVARDAASRPEASISRRASGPGASRVRASRGLVFGAE